MKLLIFVLITVYMTSISAKAQHPLVGTWEMISVKGINAEGEPFFLDTTSVRETKIITPTHYMLIAWDVEGDSLIFNRTMAGRMRLEGNKYFEDPTQASVQLFDDIKVDFSWKVDGDIFTQSGTIVRPDGKVVTLEALVFRKSAHKKPERSNRAIGTWIQTASHSTTADGKTASSFNSGDKRLLIVTPTHWMRMDHKSQKFDGVFYGTYSLHDDSVTTVLTYSSYPLKKGLKSGFRQSVEGSKLEIISPGQTPDGSAATVYDTFEKQ